MVCDKGGTGLEISGSKGYLKSITQSTQIEPTSDWTALVFVPVLVKGRKFAELSDQRQMRLPANIVRRSPIVLATLMFETGVG